MFLLQNDIYHRHNNQLHSLISNYFFSVDKKDENCAEVYLGAQFIKMKELWMIIPSKSWSNDT